MLAPLAELVPDWRDPLTGATVRQLLARLTAPRPVPRSGAGGPVAQLVEQLTFNQ